MNRCFLILFFTLSFSASAQLSSRAYRALGQPDLRQNGVNRTQGVEMFSPSGVAVDTRGGTTKLYVADSGNHRVLGWNDIHAYQLGDPPDIVLGQPTPSHSNPLGIGTSGFNSPFGLAADPLTGNLYVADTGNHRVLRFPAPFSNPGRVEPDAVYGQSSFAGRTANPAGITRNSMNSPRAVAFDAAGNLWVADTGNNRVLRYSSGVLDSPNPEADVVLGQRDFNTGAANRGSTLSASGFNSPWGLAFDAQQNLYVSDFNNARVLKFTAPIVLDAAASVVFGQSGFTTRGVTAQGSNTTLSGPTGLALANGNLYVAVPNDNRILVFAANSANGAAANDVYGQTDFNTTLPNPFTFPLASSRSFSGVRDIKIDQAGNLYAADSGNHRVLVFPQGGKNATQVLGQNDFSANGPNQIKPGSINAAYKIVIDYSHSPFALYVSDTNNHRVLGWRDATRFRTGDPADLVIGQPDFSTGLANVDSRGSATPSQTSLSSPKGLAIDTLGNLYVADSGNHRVLRYPRPFDQTGRIKPDMVIGQQNYTTAISAAVSAASLRNPAGLAISPDGTLFVADNNNNRVLEFPTNAGNRPFAIRVFGQPNFTTSASLSPASAQTLCHPEGLFVDAATNLYVADTCNNRVLIYPNTRDAATAGAPAFIVIGQESFDGTAAGTSASRLRNPADVVVDSAGNILVSDSGNHRVLLFPSLFFLPLSNGTAVMVTGQGDMNSAQINWNSPDGLATSQSLYAPFGLFVDRRDTLYVGDTGNNRVLHFLKPAIAMHAANAQTGVPVPRGGRITLSGSGFSEVDESVLNGPWPGTLAGREVVLDDNLRAPLSSVTPDSIQLQVPTLAPLGAARIAVRAADTGELIAGSTVNVAAVSPGLFPSSIRERGPLNSDGSPNAAATPANKGTVIKIFGTGQGPISPAVADGETAPADVRTIAVPTADGNTCLTRQPSVCVAIGNVFGDVQFSGMAEGLVGIWELRVLIPANAPGGDAVAVRAVINGAPTNIIHVAIR